MKLWENLKGHQPERPAKKKSRMLVLHRRQITVTALLVLVGIAGYLNWSFQQNAIDPEVAAVYSEVSKKLGEAQMVSGTTATESTPLPSQSPALNQNDYFVQAKLERDVKRSEAMDMLTSVLNAKDTDKEARTRAEDEIHRLADATEKEMMTENMIRAKGFHDTVVFMGENMVSIAVKSEGLNEVDAAILRDIAISCTACSGEQVKIVEIK